MFTGTSRRDRYHTQTFPLASLRFTAPLHVNALIQPEVLVSIDEPLLMALLSQRLRSKSGSSVKQWEDWSDGIDNFNQANSDNPAVRWQTEWVLMCSAFRRVLLTDEHKAKQVAQAFGVNFVPTDTLLSKVGNCEPLLQKWLYDFHSPRHDFAHGRHAGSVFRPHQPGGWQPIGGLLIGAILFPLLVRSLLFREGLYTITDQDRCQFVSAVELIRRFPANQYVPVEQVRTSWMELVNSEWAKISPSKPVSSTQSQGSP
jgi:hypothetical protein